MICISVFFELSNLLPFHVSIRRRRQRATEDEYPRILDLPRLCTWRRMSCVFTYNAGICLIYKRPLHAEVQVTWRVLRCNFLDADNRIRINGYTTEGNFDSNISTNLEVSAVSFVTTFIMFIFRVLTVLLQEMVLYSLNYDVLQVF